MLCCDEDERRRRRPRRDLRPVREDGWHWDSVSPQNVSLHILRQGPGGPEVYLVRENDGTWGPPGGGIDTGESIWDALKREFEEETRDGRQVYRLPRLSGIRKYVYHGHTAVVAAWTQDGVPLGPPPPYHGARHQEILDRRWVPVFEVRAGGVELRAAAQTSMPALLDDLGL
mmetsp:Transcript_43873/g.98974  ORF Transcript_43873/g.98974 Transcript_43873/m.98974 type:complete len:172 (+) Transcript_43873:1-516(+)